MQSEVSTPEQGPNFGHLNWLSIEDYCDVMNDVIELGTIRECGLRSTSLLRCIK